MTAASLAAIVTTDLTAITRGRFLPAAAIASAASWRSALAAQQASAGTATI